MKKSEKTVKHKQKIAFLIVFGAFIGQSVFAAQTESRWMRQTNWVPPAIEKMHHFQRWQPSTALPPQVRLGIDAAKFGTRIGERLGERSGPRVQRFLDRHYK